jgi:hypothetical protein
MSFKLARIEVSRLARNDAKRSQPVFDLSICNYKTIS